MYRSPVDRILEVGTIDFDTASDDASDRFALAGVNEPQALRERIVRAHEEEEPTPPGNARAGLG